MIIDKTFYGVKCDRCERVYEECDFSFWDDKSSAIENAMENDWVEINNKHYCPNCYERDEETDEIKVLEDYPEVIKTLKNFISKTLKGIVRNVFEDDSHYIIESSFYSKQRLEQFEIGYIQGLLGEKLVSYRYESGKYNSFMCRIEIRKN